MRVGCVEVEEVVCGSVVEGFGLFECLVVVV